MNFFGHGVSPRRLTFSLLTVVIVVGGAIALWLLVLSARPLEDGIEFADFSQDSTATVVFAGEFPPPERPPLLRPVAIDGDAEHLFVAESDPGQISVREYDGALLATFTIEPAEGSTGFSPIDLAVLQDGHLAVIDAAARRVVIVDPDSPGTSKTVGAGGPGRLEEPTSIDASEGVIAVADAASSTINIFDEQGRFLRELGDTLDPPLTYPGGLMIDGDTLWVSDSNAGRVLGLDLEGGDMVTILQQRFELPRGLAPGLPGRMFVVDTFARLTMLFDASEQIVTDTIADERTERFDEGGELIAPESAFWDSAAGRVYVVDPGSGRVKVYGVREAIQP